MSRVNTSFVLPDTIGAEWQVLADIEQNGNGYLHIAQQRINADIFVNSSPRSVWTSMLAIDKDGLHIDIMTLRQRISPDDWQTLMGYHGSAVTYSEPIFVQHLNMLKESHLRYMVAKQAWGLIEAASNNAIGLDMIQADIQGFMESAMRGQAENAASVHIAVMLKDWRTRIAQEQQQGVTPAIKTGIDALDSVLHGGFGSGQLIVLAARPSVGKTSLMLAMVQAAAAQGKAVQVFQLEMTDKQLVDRLMLSGGQITPKHIHQQMDWGICEQEADKLAALPMWFNFRVRTLDEICRNIIAAHSKGEADMVCIDYLQLLGVPDSKAPVSYVIAAITRRLKQLANELQIPVILLSQLNRESSKESRPPELHDLRDSGAIEQDADIVMLLDNPANESGEGRNYRELDLYLRKNRQGKRDILFRLESNPTHTAYHMNGKPEQV